jgi:hypothetical protein
MRFDCNEIADVMSEIAAYGTAVTIRKRQGLTQKRAIDCPLSRTYVQGGERKKEIIYDGQ